MKATKNHVIRAAAAVFITGSILFASSCADASAPSDGYAQASPDGKDYTYSYPENWEVIRSDSMFAVQSPDKKANISSSCYAISSDGFNTELYAGAEDPWAAFTDDYVNNGETGYIALLKDNFGENVEMISAEDCSLGERSGKKLVYHIKIGEDDYYFATVLAFLPTVGDVYLYDVTYTAADKTAFDEHIAVFDGAVSSFSFN